MVPSDSDHTSTTCKDDRTHRPAFWQFPTEILSEIFVICLPDLYETDNINYRYWPIKGGSLSMRVAPFQLCNVCSQWRSVVLSNPRLWTLLKFSPCHVNEKLIKCIHTWFSRAGTLPVTVQINQRRGWDHGFVEQVLSTLLQYISRWEFVQINMTFPREMWNGSTDAPLLRSWHMLDENVGIPFGSTPVLKDVYLNHFDNHPSSVHSIPWHQLTVLKIIEGPSLSIAMEVMQFCPMLETLWIEVDSQDVLPQVSRIEMAKLRTLHLSSYLCIRPLLESLILPMLVEHSMHLYQCYEHTDMGIDSCYKTLLDIFDRSKCELQMLGFINCNFDSTQILECLRHRSCATITDLTIANVPMIIDEVFIQLTAAVDRKEEPLLPNLAKLTVSMCIDKNVSPGLLGKMVLSRRERQAESKRLESLTLTIPHCIDETDRELLKKAEKSGMKLDLYIVTNIMDSEDNNDSEDEKFEDLSSINEEDTGSDEEETRSEGETGSDEGDSD